MTFDEYQQLAQRTARHEQELDLRRLIAALGVTDEAGELAGALKKHYGQGHPLNPQQVLDELGDVLWYVTETAVCYGFTLEQVAVGNVDKLKQRFPDGFTTEASIERVDVESESLSAAVSGGSGLDYSQIFPEEHNIEPGNHPGTMATECHQ